MNAIVIGATGTIGRLAVRDMLAAGHTVTAFARHPDSIGLDDPGLALVSGDATVAADVMAAVPGHDAVVVAIGTGKSRKNAVRSTATLNVIRAMQAHGIRRLVVQSTLGAHESRSNLNFFWKRVMFGALLRPIFKDHELQELLVRASGLDWTIVRPGAFTNEPANGLFREDVPPDDRNLTLKIPRADVAGFLSRQLTDSRYLHHAVAISN